MAFDAVYRLCSGSKKERQPYFDCHGGTCVQRDGCGRECGAKTNVQLKHSLDEHKIVEQPNGQMQIALAKK